MKFPFYPSLMLAALAFAPTPGQAKTPPPDVSACITQAAAAFGMSELPLRVLYAMEGGTTGRVSRNTNGTVDIGAFQVNSWWLRKLEPAGITMERLRDDVCTNVFVGTWIFYQEWKRTNNVAEAIAYYHSPTPKFQARYLARVSAHLDRLIAQERRKLAPPSAAPPSPAAPAPLRAGAPR
jgi:soluble lytic murein transglycosylase-like protein